MRQLLGVRILRDDGERITLLVVELEDGKLRRHALKVPEGESIRDTLNERYVVVDE